MKVKELKIGMMIKPKDNGFFEPAFDNKVVRVVWLSSQKRSQKQMIGQSALYLGQRKDLGLIKNGVTDWSNRFVLANGKVYAVDSCDWYKIEKA